MIENIELDKPFYTKVFYSTGHQANAPGWYGYECQFVIRANGKLYLMWTCTNGKSSMDDYYDNYVGFGQGIELQFPVKGKHTGEIMDDTTEVMITKEEYEKMLTRHQL